MRKCILTILILTTWATFSTGQNLVPNPSFENYTSCPNGWSQIYKAQPWFQPCNRFGNSTTTSSNTDLFNTCAATTSNVDVPSNWEGVQNARTGNGYSGIFADADTFNILEYLEVPLISPLIAGKTYCVEMYVSLSDSSKRAISNIGAFFSNDSLLTADYYPAFDSLTPQIENPNINMLNDKINWMQISGSFIAVGGEKFMTIGKFRNAISTNGQYLSAGTSRYGYYYFDDISVMDCDSLTEINQYPTSSSFKLYPNPTDKFAILEFNNPTQQNCTLTLYDLHGQIVRTINNITADKVEIERQDLASGLYFFQLRTDRQIIATGKLTIE